MREWKTSRVHFKNVFYVPKLCTNLLSVKRITEEGYEVTFKRHVCYIKEETGNIIATARMVNGMFKLDERMIQHCWRMRNAQVKNAITV